MIEIVFEIIRKNRRFGFVNFAFPQMIFAKSLLGPVKAFKSKIKAHLRFFVFGL